MMDGAPAGPEWLWSLRLVHPGPVFCPGDERALWSERRGEAARALGACLRGVPGVWGRGALGENMGMAVARVLNKAECLPER